jgi:hypothetical protein
MLLLHFVQGLMGDKIAHLIVFLGTLWGVLFFDNATLQTFYRKSRTWRIQNPFRFEQNLLFFAWH